MFKVPDWGEDVPHVKVNFDKKSKKTNKLQTATPIKTNKLKQTKNITPKSPQSGIKKNKIKNKNHVNDKTQSPFTPNAKANGPSIVSTKINGAVSKKKLKKKVFPADKTNFNDSNNQIKLIKKSKSKNKFNKNNKRPDINTTDGDKSLSRGNDTQNMSKKDKKRKMTKNNEAEHDSDDLNDDMKAKKQKLEGNFDINNEEDLLFGHNNKSKKKNKKKDTIETEPNNKKQRLKQLLETQLPRTPIKTSGNKLRDRMLERLKSAQFRYINEKLYTSSGSDAQQLFQNDPAAFQTYHEGYQQQVKKWPVNPLDVIVKRIQKMPKTHTIADMGCGEGALAKRLQHTVRSFDLVSTSPDVEVCDIAHTPLLSESMDVAVYCLALMGTDLTQYLVEANRVLKVGGHLLIAEVESRFNKVDDFTKDVEKLGFKLKNLDKTHEVFFFMEFTKIRDPPVKKSKLPTLTLKPCLYKRR